MGDEDLAAVENVVGAFADSGRLRARGVVVGGGLVCIVLALALGRLVGGG